MSLFWLKQNAAKDCLIYIFQNNWVPRRIDSAPKTIDQIHKEAADEHAQKQILFKTVNKQIKSQTSGMIFETNLYSIRLINLSVQ